MVEPVKINRRKMETYARKLLLERRENSLFKEGYYPLAEDDVDGIVGEQVDEYFGIKEEDDAG